MGRSDTHGSRYELVFVTQPTARTGHSKRKKAAEKIDLNADWRIYAARSASLVHRTENGKSMDGCVTRCRQEIYCGGWSMKR